MTRTLIETSVIPSISEIEGKSCTSVEFTRTRRYLCFISYSAATHSEFLITSISAKSYPKILSSHIPFILDVPDGPSETEFGVLRGHLARTNPQSKTIIDGIQSCTLTDTAAAQYLEEEVLVLFTVAAHHYVTPKFYAEMKPRTGKVVLTWTYAAAQVYGRAKIYHHAKSDETANFLSTQKDDLSRHAETSLMGYTGAAPLAASLAHHGKSPMRLSALLSCSRRASWGLRLRSIAWRASSR